MYSVSIESLYGDSNGNIMKKVAVDYKGKHFIIMDEDCIDLGWDEVIGYINMEWVIENGLRPYVHDCIYYGIPAYIGADNELKTKIQAIYDEYEKTPNGRE